MSAIRSPGWRAAFLAAAFGGVCALPLFAPASWLASRVSEASGERLLLADARGSWWRGDATLVLSAGADSRDAAALPGRLHWQLGWEGGPQLRLRQSCCIDAPIRLRVLPSFSGWQAELMPPAAAAGGGSVSPWLGQWPAAWLSGLGTPWNTLALSGVMRLASPGLQGKQVQGRWQVTGSASIELDGLSSRLSTLDPLGSYRLNIRGGGASEPSRMELSTSQGSLRMSGQGEWTPQGVRFRGEARAAEGSEAVLNNLLNLIGRRQGPAALIVIG